MNNYAMLFFWLLMAIVAVSLVFLVIIGVSVTAIMKKMCAVQERPSGHDDSPAASAQPVPVPVVPAASVPSDDEDEIVAVITAAVAAVCGGSARVASVTPSSGSACGCSSGNMWRITGRIQNFEGFSNV